jgi:mannose-6-phosphate isomerase-like protein (cupin superfamily)
MADYTKINLHDVEDSAAKYGYAGNHEARFPTRDLGLEKSGLSYQKLLPNKRSPFGHKHEDQEEIYVILSGSGQAKLDDDIIELKPFDAIRVAPQTVRAMAAGPDGLEMLVFGASARNATDRGEMIKDWWPK